MGASEDTVRRWRQLNRALWDERVPLHVASSFYDVEGFLADGTASNLQPFEIDEVGEVRGRTLVHPQCHIGKDTLSWARRGATVTGVDFSGPAVEAARELARRAGLPAEFVEADVYDAVDAVGGRTFDVVYTGFGAITWLPDIERWAQVMARLAAPGGLFYLAEFHPLHGIFGDHALTVEHPYFDEGPLVCGEPGSYADLTAATTNNVSVEWNHPLGAVVSAVVGAGFTVEALREYDYTLYPRWPFLERHGDAYRLPAGVPSLPLMYTLRARRAV